jgi:hypothetical protein
MDSFEKNIKRKLEDFQPTPPDAIWPAIESQLGNSSGSNISAWKIAAAIATLIVTSLSVVLLKPASENSETLATNFSNAIETPVALENVLSENEVYANITSVIQEDNHKPISEHISEVQLQRLFTAGSMEPIMPMGIDPIENINLSKRILASVFGFDDLEKERVAETKYQVALSSSPITGNSALALSMFFAPQQSYRYQSQSAFIPFESIESQMQSFSFGVNLHYKINSRFEVLSGLAYSRMGQRVHDIAVYSHPSQTSLFTYNGEPTSRHPQRMSTSMGGILFTDQGYYYADASSQRVLTLKGTYDDQNVKLLTKSGNGLIQQLNYLEIPVSVRYKFFERGFSLMVKSGISAHMLRSANVFIEGDNQNPVGRTMDIYKFNWAASAGLVMQFPLNNQLNLLLEPTSTMFIQPIGMNTHGKTYPYNHSVLIGLSYGF